jgi:hypothetical protein
MPVETRATWLNSRYYLKYALGAEICTKFGGGGGWGGHGQALGLILAEVRGGGHLSSGGAEGEL